jgi:hypothetical protein
MRSIGRRCHDDRPPSAQRQNHCRGRRPVLRRSQATGRHDAEPEASQCDREQFGLQREAPLRRALLPRTARPLTARRYPAAATLVRPRANRLRRQILRASPVGTVTRPGPGPADWVPSGHAAAPRALRVWRPHGVSAAPAGTDRTGPPSPLSTSAPRAIAVKERRLRR